MMIIGTGTVPILTSNNDSINTVENIVGTGASLVMRPVLTDDNGPQVVRIVWLPEGRGVEGAVTAQGGQLAQQQLLGLLQQQLLQGETVI